MEEILNLAPGGQGQVGTKRVLQKTLHYLFPFRPLFLRWRINPPSLIKSCIKGGMGFAKNFRCCVRSKISPVAKSTGTRPPSLVLIG
jgi:hypothetical protein